jgi:hypothetical protein
MLSGMFGLLSVDCAKAGEIAPARDSVTAPATTRLRETSVRKLLRVFGERCVSHVSAPAISADSIAGEPLNATAALRIRGGIPKRTQIAWTLTIGGVRRTETI